MKNKYLLYVQIRRKSFCTPMYRLEKFLTLLDRTVCNSDDEVQKSIEQIQQYANRVYDPTGVYRKVTFAKDGKDILVKVGQQGNIYARFLAIV